MAKKIAIFADGSTTQIIVDGHEITHVKSFKIEKGGCEQEIELCVKMDVTESFTIEFS